MVEGKVKKVLLPAALVVREEMPAVVHTTFPVHSGLIDNAHITVWTCLTLTLIFCIINAHAWSTLFLDMVLDMIYELWMSFKTKKMCRTIHAIFPYGSVLWLEFEAYSDHFPCSINQEILETRARFVVTVPKLSFFFIIEFPEIPNMKPKFKAQTSKKRLAHDGFAENQAISTLLKCR